VFGFLMMFCTDTLGMPAALVGALLMGSKVFDGFTDLFAAYIIENTNTKLGKARPYEFCIIGIWGCTFLMFCASPAWSMAAKAVWVCSMYTFVFSVFNTLLGAANSPYMIRAFVRRQVVTKVASYGGIVTTLGAMVVSITFPMLMARLAASPSGWRQLVAIYALPLLVIGLLRLIFVKEVIQTDKDKAEKVPVKQVLKMLASNRYIWVAAGMFGFFNIITNMNAGPYYFRYIVGDVSLMGVIQGIGMILLIAMFIMPRLTKRFSAPAIISGGVIISMFGYILFYFAGGNIVLLAAGTILVGAATFPLAYLQILIIMDLCTFNEWKGLPRMEATTSLGVNLFSKIGQAVGAGFMGVLLGAAGYDGTLTAQPDSAFTMIRLLYSLIPGAGMLLVLFFAGMLKKFSGKIPQLAKEVEEKKTASSVSE
jgi:Na+/melibiose symporter-like transporter